MPLRNDAMNWNATPFRQNGASHRSIQQMNTATPPASTPSHRLPPKKTAKLAAPSTLPADGAGAPRAVPEWY